MAGHHIQWNGKRWNVSSEAYTMVVSTAESAPASMPTSTQESRPSGPMKAACGGVGKSGPWPMI